ncbi:thioesterase family protein [Micromonospora fiedleri]|uniref:Thioesterase family protein n=1 Tax=Micromonospora fiedleri TaxID=1157498 RepID=A0ABS1US93_9ACTN|nr:MULTISPECIES: BTAD domain-containing putative transcriptional regulator [Micromonospora]MBL6279230.1 thioesterase family protein [Micromonospora fiedleri]WSK40011.1 thioesterase family protein [Micromonospora maris]
MQDPRQKGLSVINDADRSPPLLFEVLGPVRVRRNGQELDLGPRQQRLILALLLARGGEPVGTAEVVSMLWGSQPPASAVNIVHRYVGNLRRLFEPEIGPRVRGRWLCSDASGYRIQVDEKNLDLLSFRRLGLEARAAIGAGRPDSALAAYSQALEMWRGPCAGAPDLLAEQFDAFSAVDQECVGHAIDAGDLSLRLGSGHAMLFPLRRMATHHLYDERLQARLMMVLSAVGQQAEAIARFHMLRRKLREELGVDPGPELQMAYRQLLQHSSAPQETGQRQQISGTAQQRPDTCHSTSRPSESPDRKLQSHYDGVTHTASIAVGADDIGTNGNVRSSKYLDYSIQARWAALADAGLSIKELAAAGLGPVELDVSIKYLRELVLGDQVDVVTRFEYPSPKIVRLVQSMFRRSDGALAAVVTSVTGLMDIAQRRLVDDAAAAWAVFLRDLAVVDLAESSDSDQPQRGDQR